MRFNYEHDGLDGLVLIDEYYFNEFNSDILYSFDIFLDSKGRTELIFDFLGEKWEVVRARESAAFKDFCNSGKMIVLLAFIIFQLPYCLFVFFWYMAEGGGMGVL